MVDLFASEINDTFIDENDWVKGIFYKFDKDDDGCPILQIGGKEWADYKKKYGCDNNTNNQDATESDLLASLNRSKVLKDELIKQNQKEWVIVISDILLDDWKSLFLTFRQHDIAITNLDLGFCETSEEIYHYCKISEKGLETLLWALSPRQSGIRIQHLDVKAVWLSENNVCKKFIPAFSDLPIKSVELKRGPSWFRTLFKQHCQPPDIIDRGFLFLDQENDDDDDDPYGVCLGIKLEMKKAVEIPQDIDDNDDFFEKHDMGKRFYQFDRSLSGHSSLLIGGTLWQWYKYGHDWDDDIVSVENKLLDSFCRSRILRDRLTRWKNEQSNTKQGWGIIFHNIWLHDWKSLLLTFDKYNIPVSRLNLGGHCWSGGDEKCCDITEMGVQTLKWTLRSGFQIGIYI